MCTTKITVNIYSYTDILKHDDMYVHVLVEYTCIYTVYMSVYTYIEGSVKGDEDT